METGHIILLGKKVEILTTREARSGACPDPCGGRLVTMREHNFEVLECVVCEKQWKEVDE